MFIPCSNTLLNAPFVETDVAEDSDDDFSRVTKRQRLSSPTYDDQVELSQDQVAAFDAFERTLSQTTLSQAKPSQAVSASAKKRRDGAIALALSQHGFGHDSDMSSSQSAFILCILCQLKRIFGLRSRPLQ